ncbi:hypothetical protein TPHA_0D01640 [Tetrapisispora phaffii CBS 4417]|uniref:GDP-Man:Man(3)GlcNAc(2)-PP-Dol alpha-1,2-mannosyltransferase n=1 Tax=Tetrapisispora phaffii (strain ATCC 24235 / CBS 4417 / NBRC 1672 / NRRL Y-8282 / UCD 70-5) TaxID=1071381 RepID=G8BSI3_TETPH|nr:hypothetical protein TPHA_0D01640 [Tetrapisispora phaffii CBS 4417]CCE62804.1 hypothetical protein TPHA_0D01640 [Tetrapisispora phaffii CBS 4417]
MILITTILVLLISTLYLCFRVLLKITYEYRRPSSKFLREFKIDHKENDSTLVIKSRFYLGCLRYQLLKASSHVTEYSNDDTFSSCLKVDRKEWDTVIANAGRGSEEKLYTDNKLYGFFHPYCNAGGGGEKVLWKAIETVLRNDKKNVAIVYTGDVDASRSQILDNVNTTFGYKLEESRVVFIYLRTRFLVSDRTWPVFTLLGQAFGSFILTVEAYWRCPVDFWCDTMGYPFGYPAIRFMADMPIIAYTHFPVISTDMLDKLKFSETSNSFRTKAKYIYWSIFMFFYEWVGSLVFVSITNSTWTNNHIKSIWRDSHSEIIYPPCSTERLVIKEDKWNRKNQAVVLAQFRNEKRHQLIIQEYSKYLAELSTTENYEPPKIIFVGSTRSQNDKDYVENLKRLAYINYRIPMHLMEFVTDAPYEDIKKYLHESSYGINAMWNEHFGIAVVEYAAAGLIPLVHASAGPLLDIVVPWDVKNNKEAKVNNEQTRTGFFFISEEDPDYVKTANDKNAYNSLKDIFKQVSELCDTEKFEISKRGKLCVSIKFSDAKFDEDWDKYVMDMLDLEII